MKKYFAALLLIATIAFIALRPEQHASPAATALATTTPTASATTTPDGITVNLAPAPYPAPASAAASASPETAIAPAPDITLIAEPNTYHIYVPDGSTVVEAMQVAASSTSFTYTGHEDMGLGFFVDSIGGKTNGNGEYWFLYVNGASSQTGASGTLLHTGDTVEWRYEKNY